MKHFCQNRRDEVGKEESGKSETCLEVNYWSVNDGGQAITFPITGFLNRLT